MTTLTPRPLRAPAHTLADVLAATCAMLGCTPEDLRGMSRQSGVAMARTLFVLVARRATYARLSEIAAAMGKSTSAVGALELRGKKRMDMATEFGHTYAELVEQIVAEMSDLTRAGDGGGRSEG